MYAFRGILVVAAVLSLVPQLQAQSAVVPAAPTASEPAVFQPGDVVRITVWRNPELSGEFEIGADGTIIHPLYRSVRATGMPVSQVEGEIRSVLQRFEAQPELVVEPLFRIFVSGAVRTPNVYTLSPATSVAQAVAMAGGPTERADLSQVRLLRNGATVSVDLRRPAHELSHLRVRPGDQIIVDRRSNIWVDRISPALSAVGSVASIFWVVTRVRRGN